MIKTPRGTKDILPQDTYKWRYIEETARETARSFGFEELRVPTFEYTELFQRGVGETTDVVQKEMYTFQDKDGRSMTLRPEGTASIVRSIVENGLYGGVMPLKFYYIIQCFRYEKPQAGRQREFHQFGIELFGASGPVADAEVILLAKQYFDRLGINNLSLELNSIGCPKCRKNYHDALKQYFKEKRDRLCPTCGTRLEKNPMRILDCKSEECSEIAKGAPVILDYLCGECSDHFDKVKNYLTASGLEFKINGRIVRGLDYYTRTVFEFVSNEIGAQGTVCGGGRYDGLVEELGGKPLPGIGFALGLERLLLLMETQRVKIPEPPSCDIYIATMGEAAKIVAQGLLAKIRSNGFSAQADLMDRSLKAQMKYADKLGARFCAVIGDDEISKGCVALRNMIDGSQRECPLDGLADALQRRGSHV